MIQRSQINICRGLFSTMPFCAWIGKIGRLGNIFSCLNLCKKEPITDFCFVERDFSFQLNINIYSRGKWDKCHPSIMNVDRETFCKYVYIYYFTDLNVAKLRRHFADIPFIFFSYPQNLLDIYNSLSHDKTYLWTIFLLLPWDEQLNTIKCNPW